MIKRKRKKLEYEDKRINDDAFIITHRNTASSSSQGILVAAMINIRSSEDVVAPST